MKEAGGRGSFAARLADLPLCVGEICINRGPAGEFDLRHREDAGRTDLRMQNSAEAATEIARFDDAGTYRPLKTAPNLAHDWQLLLPNPDAVRRALDFFYPGRIAAWLALERGTLTATPLRETLGRQTGMYRIAGSVTDAEVDELVAGFCRSEGGCLRMILWTRDVSGAPASALLPMLKFEPTYDQTGRSETTLPLICQEACNLLVAEVRKVVKERAQ